jgi:hypothetical protein
MKKASFILITFFAIILQFCTVVHKVGKGKRKITYIRNIEPIMINSCAPCHFPPQGNKKPYNSYAKTKADFDAIFASIQKKPGEKGFMPARRPRLSDSTINIFRQWKVDGLLEK